MSKMTPPRILGFREILGRSHILELEWNGGFVAIEAEKSKHRGHV